MKKILLIQCSPKAESNSKNMCKYLKARLADLDVDLIDIGRIQGKHCLACGRCSDKGFCVVKDRFYPYIKKFHTYTAVVFFTPVHFFSFSASMKLFLDRLYGVSWDNKIFYLVTSSGSAGYFGGNDILVDTFNRSCEYKGGILKDFYNKVTNDLLNPLSDEDKKSLGKIAKELEEMCNGSKAKGKKIRRKIKLSKHI